MHGRPVTPTSGETHTSHPQRWRILGVLVLALLVTSIDHTIINVAMPRLVDDLGATSAQLQWIVASYTIVFAGLLLTAGSVGDRFSRRHALLAGLATFLAGSVVAATAGSTTALIVGRSVMGVGGALIMPTTLSILVNVFGDPRERAKAIAAWTAASGVGIAFGPIVGGALMRSFSWSSVFWINVPLLVAALVGAVHLVPDSRDPHATRLDPVGAVLSIAAIGSLVYAIIQAPERGWTSTASLVNFAVGTAIGIVFVAWEMRRDDPMLDIGLFRNRSFSAGSIALTLLFFAMAGTVFLEASPAVHPRLHPTGRRVRARPSGDRDAAGHRSRCPPGSDARWPNHRHHRHSDRQRRRRSASRARDRRVIHADRCRSASVRPRRWHRHPRRA